MFGNKQLVIVKDAQYLNKDIELLTPYLENYLSQTILVICYVNKRLDKRSKLFKSIKKNSNLIEFETIYESDVFKWIGLEAKKLNLKLDPKSIMLISSNIGLNLELIEKALEKLGEFDRIVVASGDHYFKNLCDQALMQNKKVVIVSTQHGLSNTLKSIPCEKITFEIKNTTEDQKAGFKWKSTFGAVA